MRPRGSVIPDRRRTLERSNLTRGRPARARAVRERDPGEEKVMRAAVAPVGQNRPANEARRNGRKAPGSA
jgi:hypothetical protein